MNHYLRRIGVDICRRVPGCKHVYTRVKSPSSIARKRRMNRRIRDLYGIRLVHDDPYRVPLELNMEIADDYISSPKPLTQYMALHMYLDHPFFDQPIELQVLTQEAYVRSLSDGYNSLVASTRDHHEDCQTDECKDE
jgi:ppGpp synthetase/RelA/SpoT-type nucleotidyltranferase